MGASSVYVSYRQVLGVLELTKITSELSYIRCVRGVTLVRLIGC
jgi:hypothetical protein